MSYSNSEPHESSLYIMNLNDNNASMNFKPKVKRRSRGRSLSPLKTKSTGLLSFFLPRKSGAGRITPVLDMDRETETSENAVSLFTSFRNSTLQSSISDSILVEKMMERPMLHIKDVWNILEHERAERMVLEERNKRLEEELENERLLVDETKLELEEVNLDLMETQEIVARAGLDWAREKRAREVSDDTCSKLKESLRRAQADLSTCRQQLDDLREQLDDTKAERDKLQEDYQNQIMQVMLSGKIREHGFYMKLSETRDAFNEKMQVLMGLVGEMESRLVSKKGAKGDTHAHHVRELRKVSDENLVKISKCLKLDLPVNDPIVDSDAFSFYSSHRLERKAFGMAENSLSSNGHSPDSMLVVPRNSVDDYDDGGDISHKKLSRDLNWSLDNEELEEDVVTCDQYSITRHSLSASDSMYQPSAEDCHEFIELSDLSAEMTSSSKTQFFESSSCSNSNVGEDSGSVKPKLKFHDESWLMPLKIFAEKRKAEAAAKRLTIQSRNYAQVGKSRKCDVWNLW